MCVLSQDANAHTHVYWEYEIVDWPPAPRAGGPGARRSPPGTNPLPARNPACVLLPCSNTAL